MSEIYESPVLVWDGSVNQPWYGIPKNWETELWCCAGPILEHFEVKQWEPIRLCFSLSPQPGSIEAGFCHASAPWMNFVGESLGRPASLEDTIYWWVQVND